MGCLEGVEHRQEGGRLYRLRKEELRLDQVGQQEEA